MAWSSPQTWATGMRLSGTTLTSGFNVQLTNNLTAARNLWDNAIHLSLSANQVIPHDTNTSVVWDHVDWQASTNSTMWAVASGARLKPTVAGFWEGVGCLEWRPNATGRRAVFLTVNTSENYLAGAQAATFASGNPINMPFGDIVQLTTAAEFLEVRAYQNSGGDLSLHGGEPDRTRFSWRLLGAAS